MKRRYYIGTPTDTIKDNLHRTSPSKDTAMAAAIYTKDLPQYVLFTYTRQGALLEAKDITEEFTQWKDKFIKDMQAMMLKLEQKAMNDILYGDDSEEPSMGLAALLHKNKT